MPRIELQTEIAAPSGICFDLALNVDVQLSLGSEMQAVGGVTSGPLALGDTVSWRSRQFGIPWRMTSRIVLVERPRRFIDEMQHGPFAHWRHTHAFEQHGSLTVMRDTIDYAAPLGPAGQLFDVLILHRHLKKLLHGRNCHLRWLAQERVTTP